MQAARRRPDHEAGGSRAPAPERRAEPPFGTTFPAVPPALLALACLLAAWASSASVASPPAPPRAVASTAQLSVGGFDSGRWQAAGPAGAAAPISLAVDPRRADHVYLATEDGVYMSRDAGLTWAVSALPGLVAFSLHPTAAGRLFAVTTAGEGQLLIWRSEDRGLSWRPGAAAGLATDRPRPRATGVALALDPSDRNRLWLGAVFEPRPKEGASPMDRPSLVRLWASTDGGDSLQPLQLSAQAPAAGAAATPPRPPTLALAALPDGTLVAATGGGIQRLPPGDEVWQPAGHGLAVASGSREVRKLAAGGAEGRVLYAVVTSPPGNGTSERRVYRSADGGARWSSFGIGLPTGPVLDLAPHPLRRSEVLVTVAGSGVFTTRGDAWAKVSPALAPAVAAPDLLTVAPGRPEVLWGATAGGDLYRRTPPPPGCSEDADTLCLAGRFRVDVLPAAEGGFSVRARAVPLTKDGGWFWFRHPEEPEVAVRATTTAHRPPGSPPVWTFYASSLSSHPFDLRVYDAVSGVSEILQSRGDGEGEATLVANFPAGGPGGDGADLWFAALPEGGCGGDSIDLCLHQGRFEVSVDWRDADGAGGAAVGDRLSGAAGWFRFLHPGEPELVVNVRDGRLANGHWQVAFASLSDLGFELTVTDRRSGEAVVYEVEPGGPASHRDPIAISDIAPEPGQDSTP